MEKTKIEEQAIIAFNEACSQGFVSPYTSKREVKSLAYEILEYMPEIKVDDLSEEDLGYAAEVLYSQLY